MWLFAEESGGLDPYIPSEYNHLLIRSHKSENTTSFILNQILRTPYKKNSTACKWATTFNRLSYLFTQRQILVQDENQSLPVTEYCFAFLGRVEGNIRILSPKLLGLFIKLIKEQPQLFKTMVLEERISQVVEGLNLLMLQKLICWIECCANGRQTNSNSNAPIDARRSLKLNHDW